MPEFQKTVLSKLDSLADKHANTDKNVAVLVSKFDSMAENGCEPAKHLIEKLYAETERLESKIERGDRRSHERIDRFKMFNQAVAALAIVGGTLVAWIKGIK